MTVYMKITKDKYELPEAIADSIIELARMCGVSWRTIDGALYRINARKAVQNTSL